MCFKVTSKIIFDVLCWDLVMHVCVILLLAQNLYYWIKKLPHMKYTCQLPPRQTVPVRVISDEILLTLRSLNADVSSKDLTNYLYSQRYFLEIWPTARRHICCGENLQVSCWSKQNDAISLRLGYLPCDIIRAYFRFTPSQRETSLQSNASSHWLSTNLESALWLWRVFSLGCREAVKKTHLGFLAKYHTFVISH